MKTPLLISLAFMVLTLSGRALAQDDGGATLSMNGAGAGLLSGANTYTGGTTVNAGALVVTGALASGLTICDTNPKAPPAVGSDTGSGDVLGTTGGTLTVNGNNSAGSGITVVGSGAGTITLSGANTYTGATTISSGVLTLTDAGSLSLTGSGVISTGTYTVIEAMVSPHKASGIVVAVAAVPEPSTWALLIGTLMALAIFRRRLGSAFRR